MEMGRAFRVLLADGDASVIALPERRKEIENELLRREFDLKKLLIESPDGMDI